MGRARGACGLVEAITYLNERNPTAAANIAQCIERLQVGSLRGQSRDFARVLS